MAEDRLFMGCSVEIGGGLKGHLVSRGVGLGAHGAARRAGGSSHMGFDLADVVMAERGLDRACVRKHSSAALHSRLRDALDCGGILNGAGAHGLELLDDPAAGGEIRHLLRESVSRRTRGIFRRGV